MRGSSLHKGFCMHTSSKSRHQVVNADLLRGVISRTCLLCCRYVYQMETGEEARLASQLMELPSDASVSFLKRRLERISFGGHQLASSQQVCSGPAAFYDAMVTTVNAVTKGAYPSKGEHLAIINAPAVTRDQGMASTSNPEWPSVVVAMQSS